jgi:flagellar biosynthesis/type III secretory pathway chaperone
MDWFFDRRNKSIATSAQKVVSDLHTELDKQATTIKELERVIFKFKNMCTDSIERDINRLEGRKRELISELESTDEQILIAQERLRAAKEEVANVLLPNNQKLTNGQYHPPTTSLDEQFLEEGELLSFLRTELGEFLFIIHLSMANDIYVYSFSENQAELVSVAKISDIAHPTRLSGLTPYEKVMVSYLLFIIHVVVVIDSHMIIHIHLPYIHACVYRRMESS